MKSKLVITLLILCSLSFGAEKSKEEMENELIDFSKIKDVIKSDGLEEAARKKSLIALDKKKKRLEKDKARYEFPSEDEFWPFISEYWLVKNASILKWNVKKPDYGLDESFEQVLKSVGIFELKFKILLVDSPNVFHFALPYRKNEVLFLLSIPFIRTMDLTKLEISILLFENYIRMKQGFFQEMAMTKEMKAMLGSNFQGKKVDQELIKNILKKYDQIVLSEGFNFKQQFTITKEMEQILKNNLKLWNAYFSLLRKIDTLVKANTLYEQYVKIYPSPELQLNWLTPK
ncbi:hypothetical protein [Halobacteriovorax sp. JY17]|uniref:hypothetical protein n=1 Tax=Halobacteriovorax sp. JY17 TaxID=2014617 RepID=UPI000C47BCB4|nr:hypothetical protein [Halobacteriovorax sp. JY17]PIK16502.1 MAG: hypothetical protein CES88_07115 [Halobacteriovorax sp. JY17]